jgi:HAD superfamily hydrolase (TIGR01549 family)
MNQSHRALIFDLDGTLVDTVYARAVAWRNVFDQFGIPIDTWRIHRRIGMSGGLFLTEIGAEIGRALTAGERADIQKRLAPMLERVAAMPRPLCGARELLAELREQEIPHGIATSSRRPDVDRALAALGVAPTTPVISREDVQRAKPEPDLLIACQRALGLAATDCTVVGDSVWDMTAAKRAGIAAVGVLSGGYGSDELWAAGAAAVYDDLVAMRADLFARPLTGSQWPE